MFPDVTLTVQCGKATTTIPFSALKAAFQAFSRVRGALDPDTATEAEIASAVAAQTIMHGLPNDDAFKAPGTEAGDFLRWYGGKKLDGLPEAIRQEDAMDEGMGVLRRRVAVHIGARTIAEAK